MPRSMHLGEVAEGQTRSDPVSRIGYVRWSLGLGTRQSRSSESVVRRDPWVFVIH